jgi:anti-sigma regulatory factor (Ser/Thr protein kinase)
MNAERKIVMSGPEVVTGHWPKRDAAQRIAQGAKHLHSSSLGDIDPCAVLTKKAVVEGGIPVYPWETRQKLIHLHIASSSDRHAWADQLKTSSGISLKRDLSEKLTSILEEMLTNALYHSIRLADGSEKYPRRQSVNLAENEKVTIKFCADKNGFFLSVIDQGGSLLFPDIRRVFSRVYQGDEKSPQMETKVSGAGLGIYLIFENATHLKIESTKKAQTTISCWVSDKTVDPTQFSFNYFERD